MVDKVWDRSAVTFNITENLRRLFTFEKIDCFEIVNQLVDYIMQAKDSIAESDYLKARKAAASAFIGTKVDLFAKTLQYTPIF